MPMVQGVNMRTGDFSTSATDLSFEGGYGIPIAVSRTYSANCIDEGPFGVGWNLSADMRTTAGCSLKSGSAPVRSVPVNIRNRHSEQEDPNLATDPVDAVIVTDSEGTETTIQRDVDGILTTPPWEKNEYEAEYEVVWVGSAHYDVLLRNKTITPEGTVYEYEKKGVYGSGGALRWSDTSSASSTPEPCNVLKVTKAIDRHGNETVFTYSGSNVTFEKSNGTTTETPLTRVEMPNGRRIDFTWTGNRITEIEDNERTVTYDYNSDGQLVMVTSPGGRKTRYIWGNPCNDTSSAAPPLLVGITSPQGITQHMAYAWNKDYSWDGDERVVCYYVDNGFSREWHIVPKMNPTKFGSEVAWGPTSAVEVIPGGPCIAPQVSERLYGSSNSDPDLMTTYYDIAQWHLDGTIYNTISSPVTQFYTEKHFDPDSYNLVETYEQTAADEVTGGSYSGDYFKKRTLKTYNFMGNPLSEVVQELNPNLTVAKEYQTDYAYWGEDKYFQQKAVRVKLGTSTYRYSFTDYFDSSAAAGKKGQTKRVYDAKNCDYVIDTGITAPSHAVSGGYAWKYQLRPDDADEYAAEFDYDSLGRATDVWKLQKIVSGTRSYVQTKSIYGSNSDPVYGSAIQVIEDYGTGKINRSTETLAFDVAGRAIHTRDGMSREFETEYDGDGNVLSVTRTDCVPDKPIATYTYGSTDGEIENGQVLSVTDELSGVVQTVEYVQSGVATGLLESTSENNGTQSYSITYDYDQQGNRELVIVESTEGTSCWRYSNWIRVGAKFDALSMFTKLNKQKLVSSTWVDSEEEFNYTFSGSGNLLKAIFAKSVQSGQQNYNTYPAQSEAVAEYNYDLAGRLTRVAHSWNTLSGATYTTEPILASDCTYAHPLSLRDSAGYFEPNSSHSGWSLQRRETYAYDDSTGFLIEADYNLNSFQQVTWTYDSAGNRNSDSSQTGSWSYDNLNQISESPLGNYSYDEAGNCIQSPSTNYQWNDLNELIRVGTSISQTYHLQLRQPTTFTAAHHSFRQQQVTVLIKAGPTMRSEPDLSMLYQHVLHYQKCGTIHFTIASVMKLLF